MWLTPDTHTWVWMCARAHVCVCMCVLAAVISDGETKGGETMEHLGFRERWGRAWGLLVGMSYVHQELAAG